MSTNLHLRAHRKITVQSTGKEEIQFIHRDLWQTPSAVTRGMITSPRDKLQMSKEYVMSVSLDYTVFSYSEDDVLCEGEPISSPVKNDGKTECNEVDLWIEQAKEQSYEVEFFVW